MKVRIDLDRRQVPRIADDEGEESRIVGVVLGFRFEGGDFRLHVVDLCLQFRDVGIGRPTTTTITTIVVDSWQVIVVDGVLQEDIVRVGLGYRTTVALIVVCPVVCAVVAGARTVQYQIDDELYRYHEKNQQRDEGCFVQRTIIIVVVVVVGVVVVVVVVVVIVVVVVVVVIWLMTLFLIIQFIL